MRIAIERGLLPGHPGLIVCLLGLLAGAARAEEAPAKGSSGGAAAAGACRVTASGSCDKAGAKYSRKQIADCKNVKNYFVGLPQNVPDEQACLKQADAMCRSAHERIMGLIRFEVTFNGVVLSHNCLDPQRQ